MSNRISGKQAVFWCITLLLLFIGYGYFQLIVIPRKVEHTAALRSVVPTNVKQIKVMPTGQLHSVTAESTVTDARKIEQIVGLISDSSPFRPSHPVSRWECDLEIKTESDFWSLKLVDSEHHGFLAYVESGQILSSEELHKIRGLIETAAKAQPNKTEIASPISPRVD